MRRLLPAVIIVASIALALASVAAFVIAERVFETDDGVYVVIVSGTISLPSGSIGDLNTLRGECGILGLSCLCGAVLLAIAPRVRDRFHRGVAIGGFVLSLAVAALFAFNISR